MASFLVPDDFRAFMRSVVVALDAPAGSHLLDAEDAFQDPCGHGGRIDGAARYRFRYLTADGQHRWTVELDEHEIRAISDGLQIEAEGDCHEVVRTHHREPTGQPLLVWGAYNDDALSVERLDDLVEALATLHQYASEKPRFLRLWSPTDDQLVAALWGDTCAVYVLESLEGYATSSGHAGLPAFQVTDHDGHPLTVPGEDCVPWPVACRALIRFAAHGDLGPEIAVDGRIPSQLLMLGEIDRQAVLAMRRAARSPSASSLPRLLPTAVPMVIEPTVDTTAPVAVAQLADYLAWARRLLDMLQSQGLLELVPAPNIDELAYQLSGHLQAQGDEAEHSVETADWLAHELSTLRGVAKLFATGGDLQLVLRRTRF